MAPTTSLSYSTTTTTTTGSAIDTTGSTLFIPPLWILLSFSFLSTTRSSHPGVRMLSILLLLSCLFLSLTSFLPTSSKPKFHTLPQITRQGNTDPLNGVSLPPPTTTGIIPSPSPSPNPATATQPDVVPVAQPQPENETQPEQPPQDSTSNDDSAGVAAFDDGPTLDECKGGLTRMQVVLFIELLCEIFFVIIRCIADAQFDDDDSTSSSSSSTSSSSSSTSSSVDITYRGFIFIRGVYTIPIILLNFSIYWIGGGKTGQCLSKHSELQLPFTHLIFYVLYCVLILIVGIYRIDTFDESSTTTTSYYDRTNYGYSAYGPPTRTYKSYFPYFSKTTSSTSSYSDPKFRFNLGCCRINF